MQNNELLLSARVSELEKEVASLKGQALQHNQAIAQSNRLTIWQFISFTLVMAGTLFGTLAWISTSLREENRQTREQLKTQIEQVERGLSSRIDQSERNINARFEDLRQVVLSQQKQALPQR